MSLIGTGVTWGGKRCLVVDAHGYPTKTVDLRWTISGTPGGKDEVSGHKRKVPITELDQPMNYTVITTRLNGHVLPPDSYDDLDKAQRAADTINTSPNISGVVVVDDEGATVYQPSRVGFTKR